MVALRLKFTWPALILMVENVTPMISCIAIWVIAVSILLPGAYGFLEKLILFVLAAASRRY